jgi:putative Mg2+ transporter-C (MgtC) family protein
MPLILTWEQIALRLALSIVAGLVIGFNRGEHGRPAGMRTTLLVCLAACFAMIQANLLLSTSGKSADSFANFDVMRLPLGILSGMGFIGAGTIIRRDNLVLGITTAATLWFVTVMGLCFGGGQIGLGLTAFAIAFVVLWGLKYVEHAIPQDARVTLNVLMQKSGPSENEIRDAILQNGLLIITWGITYSQNGEQIQIHSQVQQRVKPGETNQPTFLSQLARRAGVIEVCWLPQGSNSQSK